VLRAYDVIVEPVGVGEGDDVMPGDRVSDPHQFHVDPDPGFGK